MFDCASTADPRDGSDAIVTRYLAAPGTAAHLRTSGFVGWTATAPFVGDRGVGGGFQVLRSGRGAVHGETAPPGAMARTRHQYVPFGRVFLTVARELRGKNFPPPAQRTGQFNA